MLRLPANHLSEDAAGANGLRRMLWICPPLGVALAAAVLYAWGLAWWTAIVAALLLVCPAVLLWGVLYAARRAP